MSAGVTISSHSEYVYIVKHCRQCQAELINEVPVEICQECFCDFHDYQIAIETLRALWTSLPAGTREGLREYHLATYRQWCAALGVSDA